MVNLFLFKTYSVRSQVLMAEYRHIQITKHLSSLTLHTAVVGTVRPLLGSRRHGQAMLYLFQKHLLCWEYEYIVCHNQITHFKIKFCSIRRPPGINF
jgi:hypothetical protein